MVTVGGVRKMHKGRRYPVGAEYVPGKGTYFRVWAPKHKKAKLLLNTNGHEPEHWDMENEKNGYFSILCPQAIPGMRYWFKFSHHEMLLADPVSRYQPDGPTGPSMIVDRQFSWSDEKWPGISMQGQIIYEMHKSILLQNIQRNGTMNYLMKLKSS